jgi:cytochrome c2
MTTDHKRIGLLYFWTTLVLFGAGGAEALLIRTQLIQPNQHVVGPDLTHVASRMTLAALTIDNTPADLLHWISDPQHVKPGAKMPALDLSRADFAAIAAYLRSLR